MNLAILEAEIIIQPGAVITFGKMHAEVNNGSYHLLSRIYYVSPILLAEGYTHLTLLTLPIFFII